MRHFSCDDVIPGCDAHLSGATVEEVLAEAAAHAKDAHGSDADSEELVACVRDGGR